MNSAPENEKEKSGNKNLKSKAFKAAIFVVSSKGLSKIIRLLSNLVLTRLLVPELFGIVALARTFDTGIQLFSDVGLKPGIIRSKRAYDSNFLNTAWTLSVLRGLILWPISLLIAIPVSEFYQEPLLVYVIPLIGLTFIIRGSQSTSIVMLSKELKQGKLVVIELVVQLSNVIITIILAFLFRNIWALVIGSLIAETVKTIWSHLLKTQNRNWFKFEKDAVTELISFGKWIFISTAMTFLASQADRIILGKLFPFSLLGIYSIALIFSEVPKSIIASLSQRVLFPLFSMASKLPKSELRSKMMQQRKLPLTLLALGIAVFSCFGDVIIKFLYDQRYVQASWMLPLLVVGIWPMVLCQSIDRVLLARGKPNYLALGNFSKFVFIIIFVPLFYNIAGVFGAIVAIALNDITMYIIINVGLLKERLSLLKQDLFATVLLIVLVALLIFFRSLIGIGLPVSEYFA